MAKKKRGKKISTATAAKHKPVKGQPGKGTVNDAIEKAGRDEIPMLKAEIINLKGKLAALKNAPKPAAKVNRICEFCGHEFDNACGRYGCPNCNGEGLGEVIGFFAIDPSSARRSGQYFPIIPTFGRAGPEQSFKAFMFGSFDWQAYLVIDTADGNIILAPYDSAG